MRRKCNTLGRTFGIRTVLVAALAPAASGQGPIVVSPQVRLSPGTESWYECSVAVSQTDKNDVLVMAVGPGVLRYAAVLWAQGSPAIGSLDLGDIDPYLTAHPSDGSIWFAAIQAGATVVGWKDAGQQSIPNGRTAGISAAGLEDKPGIAIGPLSGGGQNPFRYYVLRMKKLSNGCNDFHQEKVSYADDPYNSWTWTQVRVEPDPINLPNVCDYMGWGAAPAVLDGGRIVAAIADEFDTQSGLWTYNAGKPYVVFSDDGGNDWKPDVPTQPIQVAPGSLAFATTLLERCGNVCPSTTCDPFDPAGNACSTCGDTPMQIDRRKCAPALAADHEPDPDHVYVAFYAKSSQGSSNTDLFIHRSVDGGSSFDPNPLNGDFLQLTDSMLGLTPGEYGADQLVPAMVIDACGGVNLMFYDNRHDPDLGDCDLLYDVYYARISAFGANPTVQQWRLTPQSIEVGNLAGFLGDYHHMTISADGTALYLAYISRDNADPINGVKTCYLHRVNLNCIGPGGSRTSRATG